MQGPMWMCAAAMAALPSTPAMAQVGSPAPAVEAPTRYLETPAGQKPRVVITADPELDDANSLIRYLLYTADVRTEGLIYASSQFHWTGDGKGTRWFVPGREYRRFGLELCPCTSWRWDPQERFIDKAVDAYAAAWPNLRQHDPAYPTPDALRSVIRWGNVQFDGEMEQDTPGSDLIKQLLLDAEDSPVYLHAWGGQSTIARALKSIEEQYGQTPEWPAIRARVIAKAVIHPSGDQDDTYARYIQPFWPEIRYRKQQGAIPLSYGAQSMVSEADAAYFARLDRAPCHQQGRAGGAVPRVGRWQADGCRRPVRLLRPCREECRTVARRRLCRVVALAAARLVPGRRRHPNLPQSRRQWAAGLSRCQFWRLGRPCRSSCAAFLQFRLRCSGSNGQWPADAPCACANANAPVPGCGAE